ncbi:MAG: aminoglycoside phosphotransferase family protein [Anaerolineae bacterium]
MTNQTLDIEQPDALLDYLRRNGHIAPDETPTFRRLPGGVSSRTVFVARASGETWVLKQSLAKLRVQVDWFSDPQRIHCEAAAQRWLIQLTPRGSVPAFTFEDYDEHVLAMEAIPQPHDNWKQLMLQGGLQQEHAAAFGQLLGTIHREASRRLVEIAPEFADCTFFESLRLEPFYRYVAGNIAEVQTFLNALIADTEHRRETLTHGDFSPKNILIYQNRLILLDHETTHIGDPAFDIGFSMAHLLSKGHHLLAQRADFAAATRLYWTNYVNTLGSIGWWDGFEARAARHVLGCLLARVAGRSQMDYLSVDEKARQRTVVIALMQNPPATIFETIERFLTGL